MKQHTQIGATVEEAISLALQKLGRTPEQVVVEVLQEGKKGFFGFGSRPAEVKVTVKEDPNISDSVNVESKVEHVDVEEQEGQVILADFHGEEANGNEISQNQQQEQNQLDPIEETKRYLTNIINSMGIHDLRIEQTIEGKQVNLKLHSKSTGLLIGRQGSTLNSLQQLAQLVLNKHSKSFLILMLNVENYRERRQATLETLAERKADKAVRTNKPVKLEPMVSFERKIMHNALASRLDIETYSEGEEPYRYLVIEPIK